MVLSHPAEAALHQGAAWPRRDCAGLSTSSRTDPASVSHAATVGRNHSALRHVVPYSPCHLVPHKSRLSCSLPRRHCFKSPQRRILTALTVVLRRHLQPDFTAVGRIKASPFIFVPPGRGCAPFHVESDSVSSPQCLQIILADGRQARRFGTSI